MKGVYLKEHETELILSFLWRKQDCWICEMFYANLRQGKRGAFIPEKIFADYGIIDHMEQLVRRKIYFREIAPASRFNYKTYYCARIAVISEYRRELYHYNKKHPGPDNIPAVW
jgi:hypothetical protein